MHLEINSTAALVFLIFTAPICFYVMWTDLREMKIYNRTNALLALVFLFVGVAVLPIEQYMTQVMMGLIATLIAIVIIFTGLMGGGDAKFIAASGAFIHPGDYNLLIILVCAGLLGAFTAHRLAGLAGLAKYVPDWVSWSAGKKFPFGLALGWVLIAYFGLGVFLGA